MFVCLAAFLAAIDPLTSFNHELRTVSSASRAAVCIITLIRDVIMWQHSRLTSGSRHSLASVFHL